MTEEEAAIRAELEKRANKLFSGRVDFLLSAPQLKFLPEPTVPEIAFCGRSNVGKSSLINALTGRKAIARASACPLSRRSSSCSSSGFCSSALRVSQLACLRSPFCRGCV